MYKVGGSIPGVFNLHVGQETEPSFPIHWSVNVVLEMTVCDVMRVVDFSLEFNSPLFLQYSQMITAKLVTFFLYFTYYNNM